MSLVYTEFRIACYRNLNVCKELSQTIKTCEQNKKGHIRHQIYYLSGYIVEFCYKYALFSGLNVPKYKNLYEYQDANFQRKWFQHDFNKLKYLCNENHIYFSSDIPYFGNSAISKNIKMFIDSWDVQVRYSIKLSKTPINLDLIDIDDLIDFCDEITKKITLKFS